MNFQIKKNKNKVHGHNTALSYVLYVICYIITI